MVILPVEVLRYALSCLTFSKQLEINIVHGMWSYSLIEVRHCRLFATVAFSRAARVQQNWKLAESSRSSSRRGHISLLSWTADFFLVHSDAQPFSKQLEINIVHGMWSYSLIEVRHCRLFASHCRLFLCGAGLAELEACRIFKELIQARTHFIFVFH